MVFPISFSSFGDIVTAADLALLIAKALSSSTGSSYEYQYLIQEINSLIYALRLCEAATRTGMLQQDVVNGIVAEVARCREVMNALWDRIRGYQKALGGKLGSSSTGSSWRKIGWALFKTQDVQETRLKLSTHRVNLITLMTASNVGSLEDLKARTITFERGVHIRLNEIYSALSQLPAKLGYTRVNAITLIDWRGMETLLPMDLCQNRLQFRATMQAASYKWPEFARQYVQNANVLCICENTKKLLDNSREDSYTSNLIAGNSIRVTNLVCNNLPDDCRAAVTTLPFYLKYVYCDLCRTAGRASAVSLFDENQTCMNVIHLNCDSALAQWRATVEESWDHASNLLVHQYTFHDPTYVGCLSSHVGVPVTALRILEDDDSQHWNIGSNSAPIRVARGPSFPYITAT